jgi:hypothetical protein
VSLKAPFLFQEAKIYYLCAHRMSFAFRKYFWLFLPFLAAFAVSCSVDNKSIPDPGGNQPVDTTGVPGTFYLTVSGDTSYLLTIVAVDSIINDSLGIAGADLITRDQVIFNTAKAEAGTYYTEQSPPGITGGVFIFRQRTNGAFRNYAMLHGKIVISSFDQSTGIITGNVDVNNQYVTSADKLLYIRGNFSVKVNR